MFDKPDLDGATSAAIKEAKMRFLNLVGYNFFELKFTDLKVEYAYPLNQAIYTYTFEMEVK
jgi:hypothetical protein